MDVLKCLVVRSLVMLCRNVSEVEGLKSHIYHLVLAFVDEGLLYHEGLIKPPPPPRA